MKKILLLCIICTAFLIESYSQLEHWTVATSSIMVEKETVEKTEGNTSIKVTWTSTSNQDVESEVFNVTPDAPFSYKLDVLDNTDAGRVRMVIIWSSGNDYQNIYSEDNANWQTLEYAGTVPSGATTAQIRLRFYDSSPGFAANGNSATVYVDNARYTENGGSNLITDGGFELWSAVGTLEVTAPNGGESYTAGEQIQLAWNSTGVSNVYFEVWTSDMSWEKITDNIPAVNSTYDFTIPANAWTWDGYKVRIVDADNTSLYDESNATFSITGHDTEVFWEDFGSGTLGSFEAISASGAEVWTYGSYSGTTFAMINGAGADNEDWLISPAINLDNTKNETIEFETAVNNYFDNLVVKYSTDYNGLGDPSTATWTTLPNYELSPGSWDFKRTIVDISTLSGNVYFAFIYTSSATTTNTWEVTGIYVSGVDDTSTSIEDAETAKVIVSPNPFNKELFISTTKAIQQAVLVNTAGQMVKRDASGSKRINTADLAKGLYILKIDFVDGTSKTLKVIKK
ncbi:MULTISPECIES: T9SS type A sorting domain-containing protein [unclassified Carboxylicivirga]|uniref:T9SS type A sorting domain-containing protein n=1 Tax=Carboxylicivirga TaxID=1628153 RepID=UPI003D3439E6